MHGARTGRLLVPLALGLCACLALADGDLARRAERLETLFVDAGEGFSVRRFELSTGRFYRWRIESDGRDEYTLLAPALFRNAWIQKVSIEEHEIAPAGLHAIGLGGEGAIDVWFVPIRPESYAYFVEHLRSDGFEGEFVVR